MIRAYLSFAFAALPFAACAFGRQPAPSAATLEGMVVDGSGAPIPDARVRVNSGQTDPAYAFTDAAGHFQFSDLVPGLYRLDAEKPGLTNPHPAAMSLRAGNQRTTITLLPYTVIAGRVTDPDGEPLQGCSVHALQQRGNSGQTVEIQRSMTDDLGEFRIVRLAPGSYFLLADRYSPLDRGAPGPRPTWYPSAANAASASAIELAGGQQMRADIRLLRPSGVRVAGRAVAPASGGANAITRVALVPHTATWEPAGQTARVINGSFEFRDVPPGRYTLLASTIQPGEGRWNTAYGAAQEIAIGNQDAVSLEVALRPLRGLSGHVSFVEGCTPRRVSILATGYNVLNDSRASVVTNDDGSFILDGLAPGRVSLSMQSAAGDPSPGPVVQFVRAGGRDIPADGFVYPLAGGETLEISLGCVPSQGQK